MRLNKMLRGAVDFANWCRNTNIAPLQAAAIIWWAQEYNRWTVRECNEGPTMRTKRKIAQAKESLSVLAKANLFIMKFDGLNCYLTERNEITQEWRNTTIPDIR